MTEHDLRRALHARAESVQPAGDGLRRIQARTAAAHQARRRRRQAGVAAVAAVVLLAVGLPLALLAGDDDREVRTADRPTTTAPPTTPTTAPDGGATPPPPPTEPAEPAVPAEAVWPFTPSSYDDPEAVARAFMRDYVGVPDPHVVEFRQGDARSGEVIVRPRADFDGLRTTVLVRQGEGDAWYVVGAVADHIRPVAPSALDTVTSPVTVRGESTAFEGTVQVEVRQDGMLAGESLGAGLVNGGASFELMPFAGEVAFAEPTRNRGAVVFFTTSAENGQIQEASVVRVLFDESAGGGAGSPGGSATICPPALPHTPEPGPGETELVVWFSCLDAGDGSLVFHPVARVVPETPGVLRASLEQLVAGPTQVERDLGLESFFSADTADLVDGVTIRDGTAVVDLADTVGGANTSFGSRVFLGQLDRTVFHFSTVDAVEYRLQGSCEQFWNWLQGVPDCQRTRAEAGLPSR